MFTGFPDVRCPRCEHAMDRPFDPCPRCLAADGVSVGGDTVVTLPASVSGTAQLAAAVLPPRTEERPPTPLTRLERLTSFTGVPVFVKDERLNPSFSYKDRLAEVAAVRARQAGAGTLVVASSGNHGAAVARAAAAIGLRAVVVTTTAIAPAMRRLIAGCGGQLVAVSRAEDRWRLMRAGVERSGWFPAGNFHNPPIGSSPFLVDGYQPVAWEIADRYGDVPDWVAVPVGYGDGLSGIAKGFRTLVAAGLADRLPRMLAVETTGSLVAALGSGSDQPRAAAVRAPSALSIACPQGSFQSLRAVRGSDGRAVTVDDEQALAARAALSRLTGAYHEVSSAAAFAGVRRAVRDGLIGPADSVVVVGTSVGLKDQILPGEDDAPLRPLPGPVLDDVCAGRTGPDAVVPPE